MKTISNEEPVARSRFIDCPNCKTHTLKLKRVVHVGRCKSCHESYKIVIVYVKEGKKPKASAKTEQVDNSTSPESTLPSWQVPSDSSLFGSLPSDSASMLSDTSSIFGHDEENHETPSGSGQ
jgi:DNA-directed RNA polymerase subunit M/transcription elongation factor TFIIS